MLTYEDIKVRYFEQFQKWLSPFYIIGNLGVFLSAKHYKFFIC